MSFDFSDEILRFRSGGTQAAYPTSYSTLFPSTENPISEGNIWTNGGIAGWNNMQTTPGLVFGTAHITSGFTDNCALITGFSAWLTNNYYIEAVVFRAGGYNPATVHEIELLVRGTITAGSPGTITAYEILLNSAGNGDIVRWNGNQGDFSTGQDPSFAPSGVADGDIFRVEVTGTSLIVKKNGTQIGSVSGITLSTGSPGVAAFDRGGDAVLSSMGWKSVTIGVI